MSDPDLDLGLGKRIQALRVSFGERQDAFGARFGVEQATVSRWEAGRTPKRGLWEAIAEAAGTSIAQFFHPESIANVVSVVGRIGAGAEILPEFEQAPPEGLFEIETPFPVPDGTIAFEVEGDSMWPRYDPGDVIVCWREGTNAEEMLGSEAAVRTADGRRFLKRIERGSAPGLYTLESHNGSKIRDVRIVWAANIGAVVRAGQWKTVPSVERKKIAARVKQMSPR